MPDPGSSRTGEFDNLSGSAKPMYDLDAAYDPAWWAKRFIRRERAHDRADKLRRAIRTELPRLRVASDREGAEARVGEINEMIEAVNEHLAPDDWIPVIVL